MQTTLTGRHLDDVYPVCTGHSPDSFQRAEEEGTRDQIVHILLEGGADVNMTDREGRSPLIHACEKRCNDIVRILVHHHHIKPDIEDVYGNTALIYAAAIGNDVATELLTRNFRRLGLMVDHYNKQGNTAIQVATKNGNLNCAKILAQKGRASVLLKDKEHGLTPLEWCLREGYSKEEVDFLKPNARFYRVAKLATSLSRSRSSVTSLEGSRPKVSSSKSVDSCMEVKSKDHAKAALTRSKSHTVGCRPVPEVDSVVRQATIDLPCGSPFPSVSDDSARNGTDVRSPGACNHGFQRDPDLELSPTMLESVKERNVKGVSAGSHREKGGAGTSKNPSHECTSTVVPHRMFFPDDSAYSRALPDGASEHYSAANNRCGHVMGLGCPLSAASTSVGSSDSRADRSAASNSAADNINSGRSLVKSSHIIESEDEVFRDSSKPLVSGHVKPLPYKGGAATSSRKGRAVKEGGTSASDHSPNTQRRGSGKSGLVHRQSEPASDKASTTKATDFSSRLGHKTRSSETGTAAECSLPQSDLVQTDPSQTLLQGAEYGVDPDNQFSDAGHNVLSFVTSAAVSINNFDSQTSASGQEPRMVPQVCSSPQISQDA